MKHRWPYLLGILTVACANDPGVPSDWVPTGADAGVACAHPLEGCPCGAEQPAIDCYPDPVVGEDGRVTCGRGTRYCQGGAWTACEGIEHYELRGGAGIAPLVTGPTACNMCDPSCAVSRDTPDATDLPGSSSNIDYDPVAGGIVVEPVVGSTLIDSDADGVADVADDCVGPGAIETSPGVCASGVWLYHELPFGGPVELDVVPAVVVAQSADVYFLVDTTSNMVLELAALQDNLTTGTLVAGCPGGITGAIRCQIPDVRFGIGHHDDYPTSIYGAVPDVVYRNVVDVTADLAALQTGVDALPAHWGGDGPDSQGQALWAIATGGGLGPYLTARTGCPAGTWGYPCFRDGAVPIVVLLTNSPFHNGPNGNNYAFARPALPTPTAVTSNDTQTSAYDIGDVATRWISFSGSTVGMDETVDAPCLTDADTGDVVFRFTLSEETYVTITTEGSDYDSALVVYASDFATTLGCDDDGASDADSAHLQGTLPAGTYYVVVLGWSGREGNYQLNIGNGDALRGYPVSWADTVGALDARDIHVVTIQSGPNLPPVYGLDDANALADATGSYTGSGARHVYNIPTSATGLSTAIVTAVGDLARFARMDVTARAVDDPGTATDETGFVASMTAAGYSSGLCSSYSGGTFFSCTGGTNVRFDVALQNDFVAPTAVAQVFDFTIEVLGDGSVLLATIPVRVVVPPDVPTYGTGRYWRDYDSTAFCLPNERPDWGSLSWTIVDLPSDASVEWEIRAASSEGGLNGAAPVVVTVPGTVSPVDVGARLVAAGQPNFLPYLRVTAVLHGSSDMLSTPVLQSFELTYVCTPIE